MKVFGRSPGEGQSVRKHWIETHSGAYHNPDATTARGRRRAAKREEKRKATKQKAEAA